MNTVEDLVAYIEGRFPCVEGLPTARCQTGEAYVEVSRAGAGEFDPYPFQATEAAALTFAKEAFDAYAAGKAGTLYWRRRPQMEGSGRKVRVYLRLVISDGPVVYPDVASFDRPDLAA